MKKLPFFVIILTILSLFTLMSSCSETVLPTENTLQSENTNNSMRAPLYKPGVPLVVDLFADQNVDVGEVNIWDDGTNLYVEYHVTEPGWCITETQMHVATTLAGIPQTKKGNPIPGQFDYKHEDLNCETPDSYQILLADIENLDCMDELYVATHAVVKNFVCTETNETGVLYGIQRFTGDIYGIDVINGTAWLEFSSIDSSCWKR